MFTLKFFAQAQQPGIAAYRCVAVREFEVLGANPLERSFKLYMTWLDGTTVEWTIKRGEYVIVENADGKTIDKLRWVDPDGSPGTAPSCGQSFEFSDAAAR